MATYTPITRKEFEEVVFALGFTQIVLPGTNENTYSKVVGKNLACRIYSGIVGDASRDCGKDAIRVALYWKDPSCLKDNKPLVYDGKLYHCTFCGNGFKTTELRVIPVGSQKRVHRVAGWRENLAKRLDNVITEKMETCHCGRPMVIRVNAKQGSSFWGCVGYNLKLCKGTKPIR